jgi:hypothetical protein
VHPALVESAQRLFGLRGAKLLLLMSLGTACVGQRSADAAAEADAEGSADTAEDTSSGGSADTSVEADTEGSADTADDTDAEVSADTTPPEPLPWRSALYPEDWQPDPAALGPSLDDYSYAGYALGAREPGAPTDAPHFAVADFGLALDGSGLPDPTSDSTAPIQAAIDAATAAGGGIVDFAPGAYRIDDRLFVRGSGVVLRGAADGSSRLRFTRTDGMNFAAHLTVGAAPRLGSHLPLTEEALARGNEVTIAPTDGLSLGDSVVIGQTITDGYIADHGMTGTWIAFNGSWQPFAWRRITALRESVDAAGAPALVVTLDVPLREPFLLRDLPSLRTVTGQIRECGIEQLSLSNAALWEQAWEGNQVHLVAFLGAEDCWVDGLRSFAPDSATQPANLPPSEVQSSGLMVEMSRAMTIRNSRFANAQHRGSGGNGYLFEVRQSNEILTQDCTAENGRHNFIQNWGFGTSGCVWHRVESRGSAQVLSSTFTIPFPAASEFHHSLATANLIDSCIIDDGWQAHNRGDESTGAGLSAWKNVFWNNRGTGFLSSRQWALGYVIGTAPELSVRLAVGERAGASSAPEDWAEGLGSGATLEPASLFLSQRQRRLGGP